MVIWTIDTIVEVTLLGIIVLYAVGYILYSTIRDKIKSIMGEK